MIAGCLTTYLSKKQRQAARHSDAPPYSDSIQLRLNSSSTKSSSSSTCRGKITDDYHYWYALIIRSHIDWYFCFRSRRYSGIKRWRSSCGACSDIFLRALSSCFFALWLDTSTSFFCLRSAFYFFTPATSIFYDCFRFSMMIPTIYSDRDFQTSCKKNVVLEPWLTAWQVHPSTRWRHSRSHATRRPTGAAHRHIYWWYGKSNNSSW